VAISADEATLNRLREGGASEAVLQAVRDAALPAKPAATRTGPTVTYGPLLTMVKQRLPDEVIIQAIQRSPTIFTLGADQEQELRDAGASPAVIDAIKRRAPAATRELKEAEFTDVAIVLDCSGSMKEHTSDGESKIDAAKKVFRDFIGRVREGLGVTLVVYGHDQQLGCQAVKVVRPLSKLDRQGRSELIEAVEALNPAGKTPIALALRTAGGELAKSKGISRLVLISDGKENCKGDPAAEAAKWVQSEKLSRVDVIGFDVTDEERTALNEIAEKGCGKYYDVHTAGQLAKAFVELPGFNVPPRPTKAAVWRERRVPSALPGITVMPLTWEGFPKPERVFLVTAGRPVATYEAVQKTAKLGTPMLVKPGKYDVGYNPTNGNPLVLAKNVEVRPKETVELNADPLLSAITVKRPNIPGVKATAWYIVNTGELQASYASVQHGHTFGELEIVPAGKAYDVLLVIEGGSDIPIRENMTVEAGQQVVIDVEKQ
jgi:Mg-chelatase subunit ChlD